MTLTKATSGQSLTFTGGTSGKTGTSNTFTVDPGAAASLSITGSATKTAGAANALTITAKDVYGNIATGYTGDKSLTFSGANESSAGKVPTVSDNTGTAIDFGTPTAITFNNGVSSLGGSMVLYKVETATIAATDGTISTASVGGAALTVTVRAASAPVVHHTGGEPSYNYLNINASGVNTSVIISSSGVVSSNVKASSSAADLDINIPSGTRITNSDGSVPSRIDITINTSIPAPPSGSDFIGLAYNCTPDGLVFNTPITMVWHYSDTDINTGMDESSLKAAFYNTATSTWDYAPCVVDTVNNTVTAAISHFTDYAVVGAVAPAPSPTPTPSATPTPSQTPAPSIIPAPSLMPTTPATPSSTTPSASSTTLPASTWPASSASTTPPPTPASNWGLIVVIIVVVIVIIPVVWLVFKRKGKTT